jgi:hypothetical protein
MYAGRAAINHHESVLAMTTVHVTYISWQDTHNMNVKNMAFCHQPKALHVYYHDYTSSNTYLHLDLSVESTVPQLLRSKYSKIHISRLIGTASHPDMQKIGIGLFFENRLL